MADKFLTTEEVAEIARMPIETLRWMRYQGDKGPRSFKLGRRVLYTESDVREWIDAARDGRPQATKQAAVKADFYDWGRIAQPHMGVTYGFESSSPLARQWFGLGDGENISILVHNPAAEMVDICDLREDESRTFNGAVVVCITDSGRVVTRDGMPG